MNSNHQPKLNAELLLSETGKEMKQSYTAHDTIVYNLGIGLGAAAIDDHAALRYVLEDRLETFPTMPCVLASESDTYYDPKYGINFAGILHGEESIEILRRLPPEGTVKSISRVERLWDRGPDKGAVMAAKKELYDTSDGALVAINRSTLMLRYNGGFGGSAEGTPKVAPLPERDSDGSYAITTRPEQALIYRLSGDTNPLHAVPDVAKEAGFPGPILHGLCSFGVSARAIVEALADGDAGRLKRFSLRFASPSYPGETIQTEYWRLDNGEIAFRARVKERDKIVLTGGRAVISAG